MSLPARTRDLAFIGALALLAVGHGIAVCHSIFVARLWEDEAFNLTVPLNVLAGLGYTSDGTLSGSELTPFDPRISTGPVVLLPVIAVLATGMDLVVGARLVPALYYVALLVAVAVLGRRIAGRPGAVAAIAVPLAFTAATEISPIQGPADVLGEIPAAALLAWALVALRRRPWLAGLLIGCAVQAKYISLLAVPAFVIGFLLLAIGARWGERVRRLAVAGGMAAVPTILVEMGAFAALGPSGFVDHLRETVGFLRTGGQPASRAATVEQKLDALLSAWHVPPAVALVIGVLAFVLLIIALVSVLRSGATVRAAAVRVVGDRRVAIVAVATIGLLTYLAWWISAAHLPAWIRHPAPGILAFVPVLAAAVVLAVRTLRARGGARRVVATTVSAVVGGALVAQSVLAVAGVLQRDTGTLAAQRQAAVAVAEADEPWIAVAWGTRVSVIVLAGSHVALTDAPRAAALRYPQLVPVEDGCDGETVLATSRYLLCRP